MIDDARSLVRLRLALVLAGTLVWAACATGPQLPESFGRSVPVVLWFEDYKEVFEGTATSYGNFRPNTVDVRSRIARTRCVGVTLSKVVPPDVNPPHFCDGMLGMGELSCSDGRIIQIRWAAEETCDRGYGEGQDADGNRLRLVYGGSEQRAGAIVQDALRGQAGLPPLPLPGPEGEAGEGDGGAMAGASTGTAFFVSWEGHLITNHHVVSGAKRVQVQLMSGETLEAQILELDEENDLALLQVEAIRRPLMVAPRSAVVRGQEVFTLGYPLISLQGQEQKATFGHVNSTTGMQGDPRFAQIDVPIQPGNSGGPLIDGDGGVVGVVTSMLHPKITYDIAGVVPQNVNYAVKSDYVHALMTSSLPDGWHSEPWDARTRDYSELVSEAEKSVVLVVAW
jgi:S1-C subfamily serine protease